MRRSWCLLGLVLLILAGGVARADTVAAKNQALLLLRILAYDHNLADRADKKTVTIVVLYKPGNSDSEETSNELLGVLKEVAKSTTIANNSIQVVRLGFTEKTFDADVARMKAAALYVSPALGENLGTITSATQQRKLLSFTGNDGYVGAGVSVGFALEDNKPVILVNLSSSRSEGADLDAAMLRVAKIVKK